MKPRILFFKTAIAILVFSSSLQAQNGLLGWATYYDLGQNGTTGGGNGAIVRVTSKAELETYALADEPYTILVDGAFTGTGMVEVASNKSIIGLGSGTTFDGFGLNVNGKKNIVIRNLTIKKADPDAIAIRSSHHVWIDHCDLSDSDDGLLDFTLGSDYLTVSWCRFHNHSKVALVNSGTQHFEDAGRNRVTYHHNWFYNTVQRNPRIGYGKGHVFNNYYTDVSSYCVGYHTGASVLVENNYFKNSANPLNQMYETNPSKAAYANAKSVGNVFDNITGNTSGTGRSFDPGFFYDYSFALDSAQHIPALAQSYAGPTPGTAYEFFPTPGNGSLDVRMAGDSLAWTGLDSVASWDVYLGSGDTSLTKKSTLERFFKPENLEANTEYFWKVHANRTTDTVRGPLWRFKTAAAKASKPYPADTDTQAHLRQISSEKTCSPLTLTWKPGFRAVKYRVYFGENQTLDESDFKVEVSTPSFSPGPLAYGVKYYWRITSIAADGTLTEGDIWNFQSDISYADLGKTETEDMVLNGRAFIEPQDGSWFPASNRKVVSGEAGPGTMSCVWAGQDSVYTISVRYFDENDGSGWYGFYINEELVDEWFASANNNTLRTHMMDNIALSTGDELRIAFYTHEGELNRTDWMDVKVFEDQAQGIAPLETLEYPPYFELNVSLYSITGSLLTSYEITTDASGSLPDFPLNNHALTPGLYIFTIQGKNVAPRSGKVLIQNDWYR